MMLFMAWRSRMIVGLSARQAPRRAFRRVLKKWLVCRRLIDETTAPPEYHRYYFLAVNYFKVRYKSWFKVTFP
jgi:hypothetical protein